MTALHHAISEGHGDAAILLLKSGAEAEKRDSDGKLAIELVPDDKVCSIFIPAVLRQRLIFAFFFLQVKQYILQTAERDGIELP